MKFLLPAVFILLFQSCITIKVYPSAEATERTLTSRKTRPLLSSGKTVVIKGQEQPLFFVGEDQAPLAVFSGVRDSTQVHSKVVIRLDSLADAPSGIASKSATWVAFSDAKPLVVIDGQIQPEGFDVEKIQPDTIATINVLKGPVALEKYGAAGADGVIVIVTKK